MANTKSAAKRARQTTVRALRNRTVRTRLRKMQKGLAAPGANAAAKDLQAMISAIDKAAKRGIIHRSAANRRKARLNRAANRGPTDAGNQDKQGDSEANS